MFKRKNGFIKIIAFATFAQMFVYTSLFAQGLDATIFDQIKRGTGAPTEMTQVRSPIDNMREREYVDQLNEQLEKRLLAGPSLIEENFNSLTMEISAPGEVALKQFGYSIFNRVPLMDNMMTGTVPDGYELGVGDNLIVSFKGSREEVLSVQVDREGRLIVPFLPPVKVSGLTLGEVRSIMNRNVSNSLIGTKAYLSVSTLRQISVLVAGEVENPTLVRTTSLSTPIEVLLHVGGVKKTGSLRNITIIRGNKNIPVDLYNVIEGSRGEFNLLRDGDRLIVPTIGATVAISGNVIRPGIYELPRGQESISSNMALDLAGGPVRKRGNSFTHLRYDDTGRLNFEKLNLSGNLSDGEIVVVNLLVNSQRGKVSLVGHVKTPGIRSVDVYNNVRDLIGSAKNLGENPYLLFGVIERTDELTQTRNLIPFNPQKVLYGDENYNLVEEDKVILFGKSDIDFLRSEAVRSTIFGIKYDKNEFSVDGSRNSLYCKPIQALSNVINDTLTQRFDHVFRAMTVHQASILEDNSARALTYNEERQVQLANASRIPVTGDIETINNPKLPTLAPVDNNLVNTAEIDNYEFCPLVYQDTDQLLTLTIEHIVAVTGSVRQPGIFPVTDNTSVSFLLAVAGGPSNDADMANIETINYNRQSNNLGGVLVVNSINAQEVDVKLNVMNAGGSIHLRSKYVNIETGGVVVSGEVVNPGIYTIRKGEKLSSLIKRAGGLTKQGYSYGAVLTRESVKENQRIEMGKTAQRLKSALMSSSVKTDAGGEGLAALMAMIDQMDDQEFSGRIIIEADQVVIDLDPSKDVVLEGGDNLYIPPRLNFVMTVGDVLSPSALSFVSGKNVNEYLEDSGGFNVSADKDRAFAILPNGVAKPLNLGSWGRKNSINLPPGSSIVVPTNLSPYDGITLTRELGIIFQSLAVSAASLAVLTR